MVLWFSQGFLAVASQFWGMELMYNYEERGCESFGVDIVGCQSPIGWDFLVFVNIYWVLFNKPVAVYCLFQILVDLWRENEKQKNKCWMLL